MALIAAYLWLQGVVISPYIDDWLIIASSYQDAIRATEITPDTLHSLGLKVNITKSHLQPAQTVNYIGAYFDSLQVLSSRKNHQI